MWCLEPGEELGVIGRELLGREQDVTLVRAPDSLDQLSELEEGREVFLDGRVLDPVVSYFPVAVLDGDQ